MSESSYPILAFSIICCGISLWITQRQVDRLEKRLDSIERAKGKP